MEAELFFALASWCVALGLAGITLIAWGIAITKS
jgi:hypothetical protein